MATETHGISDDRGFGNLDKTILDSCRNLIAGRPAREHSQQFFRFVVMRIKVANFIRRDFESGEVLEEPRKDGRSRALMVAVSSGSFDKREILADTSYFINSL